MWQPTWLRSDDTLSYIEISNKLWWKLPWPFHDFCNTKLLSFHDQNFFPVWSKPLYAGHTLFTGGTLWSGSNNFFHFIKWNFLYSLFFSIPWPFHYFWHTLQIPWIFQALKIVFKFHDFSSFAQAVQTLQRILSAPKDRSVYYPHHLKVVVKSTP